MNIKKEKNKDEIENQLMNEDVKIIEKLSELELNEKKEYVCKKIVEEAFKYYIEHRTIFEEIFVRAIIIDKDSHKMKIIDSSEVKNHMQKFDLTNCFIFKCTDNLKEDCFYVSLWTDKKF